MKNSKLDNLKSVYDKEVKDLKKQYLKNRAKIINKIPPNKLKLIKLKRQVYYFNYQLKKFKNIINNLNLESEDETSFTNIMDNNEKIDLKNQYIKSLITNKKSNTISIAKLRKHLQKRKKGIAMQLVHSSSRQRPLSLSTIWSRSSVIQTTTLGLSNNTMSSKGESFIFNDITKYRGVYVIYRALRGQYPEMSDEAFKEQFIKTFRNVEYKKKLKATKGIIVNKVFLDWMEAKL